tara:strand:+ start:54 stop:2387 length:2334 start_codon:yes stop_codon:yes gene_type:complete
MDKLVKEGQTQVYSDGSIDPQFGIETNKPYLNQPPKQLLDIVGVLYSQSGKTKLDGKNGKVVEGGNMTDSQVLAVLVGMGTPQQLALSAINAFKANMAIYTENNNNQKNHNKMKFTLTSLYENVMKSIEALKVMESDSSRVSYTAKNALSILEESVKSFPLRFKDESVISEDIEKDVNPNLKFQIASRLHRDLASSDWINSIKELRSYIFESYDSSKWSFRISEAVARVSSQRNPLYTRLAESLTSVLDSDDIKTKFSSIAAKNPWSVDCKAILNEMRVNESKATTTANVKTSTIFSPVLESEGSVTFHLNGKNYKFDGKEITEAQVNDPRFYDVLEGMKMFSHKNGEFVTFGEKGMTLEYNLSEGTLTLGKKDLSNASIIEIKEALLATGFFGYRNQWKADTVCKFFESADMLCEMDNFTNLTSNDFAGLLLTVLTVESGVWVNKVNTGMQLNEMKFIPTATEAVKVIKEFINYDASEILSEMLIAENHKDAIVENKRKEINDKISFLEEKKTKVKEAIDKVGDSEELTEAMNLLEEEIAKFEKELQETYDRVTLGGNKGDKSKTHDGEDYEKDEEEEDDKVKEGYGKMEDEEEEKKEEGYEKSEEEEGEEVKEAVGEVITKVEGDEIADEVAGDDGIAIPAEKGDGSETAAGIAGDMMDMGKPKSVEGKGKDLITKDQEITDTVKGEGDDLADGVEVVKEEEEVVVEKKSEKDYLNDGYVKANVIKAGNGLRKGMDVMVNAEEYTSLGDDDMLEVIDPKKGKTTIVQKANLKVQI